MASLWTPCSHRVRRSIAPSSVASTTSPGTPRWRRPQTLILGGGACLALAIRYTDREVATLVLTKAGPVESLNDLRGRPVPLGGRTSSELDLEGDCGVIELESSEYPGGGRWVQPLTTIAAIDDGKVKRGHALRARVSGSGGTRQARPSRLPQCLAQWRRSGQYPHYGFAARPGLEDDRSRRFVKALASMTTATRTSRRCWTSRGCAPGCPPTTPGGRIS